MRIEVIKFNPGRPVERLIMGENGLIELKPGEMVTIRTQDVGITLDLKSGIYNNTEVEKKEIYKHPSFEFDQNMNRVKTENGSIELPDSGAKILGLLSSKPNIPFSASAILSHMYPNETTRDNASARVRSDIFRLRKSLGILGINNLIVSVNSKGYFLYDPTSIAE